MRKIVNLLLCIMVSSFCSAQDTGIQFGKFKNWQDVLKAARASQKPIFIDVYATWCGPCKKMDSFVYRDEQLGKYVNDNFISVKIQFDKTSKDDDFTKGWYNDVLEIQRIYAVQAFPTVLFISSDAKLIEKGAGFQPVNDFFGLVKRATDPSLSFASSLEKFKTDKLSNKEIFSLALRAKQYNMDSIAFEIARIYKKKVIDNQQPETVLNPENYKFFISFYKILSPADNIVNYMYKYPAKADALMGQKYSNTLTYYLIYNAMVIPQMKKNGVLAAYEPDWNKLQKDISKAYDSTLAKKMIINGKLSWYSNHKDWPNVVKYSIETTDLAGIDTSAIGAVNLNNMVYDIIFKHSEDLNQLKKGLEYMQVLLKKDSVNHFWIDTYANLLYKAGQRNEAIKEQKRALSIAERRKDTQSVKEIAFTLEKMQSNKPTWPIDEP